MRRGREEGRAWGTSKAHSGRGARALPAVFTMCLKCAFTLALTIPNSWDLVRRLGARSTTCSGTLAINPAGLSIFATALITGLIGLGNNSSLGRGIVSRIRRQKPRRRYGGHHSNFGSRLIISHKIRVDVQGQLVLQCTGEEQTREYKSAAVATLASQARGVMDHRST